MNKTISFHEMGLDDRLVKVIFSKQLVQLSNIHLTLESSFVFHIPGDCKAELVSTISNSGWSRQISKKSKSLGLLSNEGLMLFIFPLTQHHSFF